mmetsp:Transcript_27473/g.67810  ORF Transcript_27473/g.67810 Transcript_27473/m.67810 type:complete len:316 (-) Transcript_27473:297-1244(-)
MLAPSVRLAALPEADQGGIHEDLGKVSKDAGEGDESLVTHACREHPKNHQSKRERLRACHKHHTLGHLLAQAKQLRPQEVDHEERSVSEGQQGQDASHVEEPHRSKDAILCRLGYLDPRRAHDARRREERQVPPVPGHGCLCCIRGRGEELSSSEWQEHRLTKLHNHLLHWQMHPSADVGKPIKEHRNREDARGAADGREQQGERKIPPGLQRQRRPAVDCARHTHKESRPHGELLNGKRKVLDGRHTHERGEEEDAEHAEDNRLDRSEGLLGLLRLEKQASNEEDAVRSIFDEPRLPDRTAQSRLREPHQNGEH